MKRIILLVLILIPFVSFSQEKDNLANKKLKLGIDFGVNQSYFQGDKPLPNGYSYINKPGINIGLLAEYSFTNAISILPKCELSIGRNQIETGGITLDFHTITANFITHLKYSLTNKNSKPFLLFGSKFILPITDKSGYFKPNSSLALDIGIGMDKYFTRFIISPEFRYSYGLNNINNWPWLSDQKIHTVSLFLGFSG